MEFFNERNLDSPPASDEFELTTFGPGCGECLVLHCGDQKWCVIDSCRYPKQTRPIALQYLEKIGIDPITSVRSILVTHWHDDHIGGMAALVRHCSNARFNMSGALHSDQFFQLVLEAEAANKLVKASTSASEFGEILEILEERNDPPPYSIEDGSIIYQDFEQRRVSIQAVSPSSETVRHTRTGLAERILTSGHARRFRRVGPNDLSVAVQVVTPTRRLLLKADLEDSTHELCGWRGVLASRLDRPKDNSIVKIGHHGSSNADNDNVWSTIVTDSPLSVVTPYSKLQVPLPRADDVLRILSRNGESYCTTWPPSTRPLRRPLTDAFMNTSARNRRTVARRSGAVRLRFSLTDYDRSPTIELFGSARQLTPSLVAS